MSTEPTAYSLDARYANRAISHAYWALGIAIGLAVLHSLPLPPADGIVEITWGAWILFEVVQVARYAVKAGKAAARDGRSLRLSIYDGAFLSAPKGKSE